MHLEPKVLGGPDVIVGDIPSFSWWGERSGVSAFSIATTSCNVGNAELSWKRNTPEHPVIAQNLYRLEDGKFEQIGMSWLKHGYLALQRGVCATAEHPCRAAATNQWLGVGCSDPYSSTLNGDTDRLGPRSDVNASTGEFPYPFTNPAIPDEFLLVARRLQVKNSDIDRDLHPNAKFFVEAQYVTRDDSKAGNAANNASSREVNILKSTDGWRMAPVSGKRTLRTLPAILAWSAEDPLVRTSVVDLPGDGRINVAIRTTSLASGGFSSELAIHNLNSDRSVSGITVTTAGGSITNPGFHDVDYHSGESYDASDWPPEVRDTSVSWNCTNKEPGRANAIRWGTCYSFRFASTSEPIRIDIRLLKLGDPTQVSIDLPESLVAELSSGCKWAQDTPDCEFGTLPSGGTRSFRVLCAKGVSRQLHSVVDSEGQFDFVTRAVDENGVAGWEITATRRVGAAPGYFETQIAVTTTDAGDPILVLRGFGVGR